MKKSKPTVSPIISIFIHQFPTHLRQISKRPASKLVMRGELDTIWLRGDQINIQFLSDCIYLKGKKIEDLYRLFRSQKAYQCPEFNNVKFFVLSSPRNKVARSEHYVQFSATKFENYREFVKFSEKLFGTTSDRVFLQRLDTRVIFRPEIIPVELLYRTFYSQMSLEAHYPNSKVGTTGCQIGKGDKLLRFYDARFKRKGWNDENYNEVRVELQLRAAKLDKALGTLTVDDLPTLANWKPFSCVQFHNIWRQNGRVRVRCNKRELEDFPKGYYYRPYKDWEFDWANQFQDHCQAYNFWQARRRENNWHRSKASIIRPLHISGVLMVDLLNGGFQKHFSEWLGLEFTPNPSEK